MQFLQAAKTSPVPLSEMQNNQGNTLLHQAVRFGCKSCVEWLLHEGLRADSGNNLGQTPREIAEEYRRYGGAYKSIIIMLEEKTGPVQGPEPRGVRNRSKVPTHEPACVL